MSLRTRLGIVALAAVLAVIPAASSVSAEPAPPHAGGNDLQDVEYAKVTLEYAKAGPTRLRMAIYTPKEFKGKLPLVVWIYGSGWANAWTDDSHSLPGGNAVGVLVKHGYAVASISHRLSGQAVFPAQIEDCKSAIRFLRANAEKYSLDAERIGVWGASSGGHLAALLGTSGGVKELEGAVGGNPGFSSRVQCVADFSGPTDLLNMGQRPAVPKGAALNYPEQLVGGGLEEHKDLVAKANPINYVTKDAPPFLVVHGDKDKAVPINQSQLLVEALKKAGVEVAFEVVKGGGHGGGTPEQGQRNIQLVTEFFDKHLRGIDPPPAAAAPDLASPPGRR